MRHVDIVGTPQPIQEMQGAIQTEQGPVAPIQPLADPRYDTFVAGCERAGAYHAGAWGRILKRAYGLKPTYLALPGEDGSLEAVMPLMASRGLVSGRRLRSLPVLPPTGPIGTTVEAEIAVIRAAMRLADERRAGLFFASRAGGYGELLPELEEAPKYPAWITPLPGDPDSLRSGWKKTSNNLYRNIGKSEKAGVRVREGEGSEDLRSFYRLYLGTMRLHHSLPRSWSQLSLDQALLGPNGTFRLFIAEHETRPVAAAVFHAYRDTVDLLYNGSDESARDLRPNFALYWHAVSWAIENGYSRFDWGEAQEGGPLSRFKAQWSAEPVAEYRYGYTPGGASSAGRAERLRRSHDALDAPGERSRRQRILEAAWDRTPLPLTRAAGALVYRVV